MKTQRRLLGLLATLFYAPLIHAALTVDGFDTAQGPLTGAGTFNAVSGSGIIGGERDVLLSSFPATSSFSVATDVLNLTQTSGFHRHLRYIRWHGQQFSIIDGFRRPESPVERDVVSASPTSYRRQHPPRSSLASSIHNRLQL